MQEKDKTEVISKLQEGRKLVQDINRQIIRMETRHINDEERQNIDSKSNQLVDCFDEIITALTKDTFELQIQALDISHRTKFCLLSEDIETIEDLVQCTEKRLSQIPNFGKVSLNEVKNLLSEMSMSLKPRDFYLERLERSKI